MFVLYKNQKPLARFQFWEDAEDFVNELKRLNPNEIDRRQFVIKCYNDMIKKWSRR